MVVNGFKCLKCFSTIFVEYYTFRQDNGRIPSHDSGELKSSDVCKCSNCALLLDRDGIVHLYCDDINTVLLCRVQTDNPSDSEILQSPKGFYYQDYSPIARTGYIFTDTKSKTKKLEKKQKKASLSDLQKSFNRINKKAKAK